MSNSNHNFGATAWDEFVGQESLVERIQVEIDAVLMGESDGEYKTFPHTMFFAFPGAGKTTLARIIAAELGDPIDTFVMPVDPMTLDGRIMTGDPGILFFDEIHRATKKQQEGLLTLMEEGYYTTAAGTSVEISGITVLAATTRKELLDAAVLDRFVLRPSFDPYTKADLTKIINLMAGKAGVPLPDETIDALGAASAGTPRNARRLVLAARSLHAAYGEVPTPAMILDHAEVTPDGLTSDQVQYLKVLARFNGKAGVAKIASAMRVGPGTLPEVERHLFDSELIDYTDRGRTLTSAGFRRVKEL